MLAWLTEPLAATGYAVSKPDAEDWGWYLYVTIADARYMVDASSELDDDGPERRWVVQIEKHRSFIDRLLGRSKLLAADPLCKAVEQLIRGQPGFHMIEVDLGS